MKEIKRIQEDIHNKFCYLPEEVKKHAEYNTYMREYMRNVYRKTHHRVTITLSPDEYQRLQQEADASQRKLAPFIRETVLATIDNRCLLPKDTEHALHEVTLQIRHIGNNLNQIAHQVNTHKRADKDDIQRSMALLKNLETLIRDFVHAPVQHS